MINGHWLVITDPSSLLLSAGGAGCQEERQSENRSVQVEVKVRAGHARWFSPRSSMKNDQSLSHIFCFSLVRNVCFGDLGYPHKDLGFCRQVLLAFTSFVVGLDPQT